MKSKLGIYGDSFTREASFPSTKTFEEKIKDVWSNNKVLTDEYDIKNYGEQGSDFMFSYNKFKKTHHLYDKIVFVVTSHERHHFYINDIPYFVNDLNNIDFSIKIKESDQDENLSMFKNILNSLKYHYVYTMQEELYAAGVTKLIEEMKKIKSDIVIEYAFTNQFSDPTQFNLTQVSAMENSIFDINLKQYKDCRPAHMTIENNIVFAEYIKKRLKGKDATLSLSDFVIPQYSDRNKYFEKFT